MDTHNKISRFHSDLVPRICQLLYNYILGFVWVILLPKFDNSQLSNCELTQWTNRSGITTTISLELYYHLSVHFNGIEWNTLLTHKLSSHQKKWDSWGM